MKKKGSRVAMSELTKEQQSKKQLALELLDESLKQVLEGNLKDAEKIASRARDIFEELNDKYNLAMTLNRMSVIYSEIGNESLDLEYLLNAIEVADESDDFVLRAKLQNNLGSKYLNINNYERALECFKEAHTSFEKVCEINPGELEENYSFVLILQLNLTTIYLKKNETEHARKHFLLAQKASLEKIDADLVFVFHSFAGNVLLQLSEEEKAREYIASAIKLAEDTEYTTDYFEVMSDLVTALKKLGDYENWDKILSIMESRLSEEDSLYVRIETLKYRIQFYKEIGDDEKYKEATAKFYELSLEKIEEDNEKKSEMLELQIEMRRAAKEKKHVDRMAYLDSLTGAGNRNRMLEDSKVYIEESEEKQEPLTVGLIDVDFFKDCNDTYGHITGDKYLKKVSEIIKTSFGKNGHLYRYGGDEFLLLIPGLSMKEIEKYSQSIREELAKVKLPNKKSQISDYVTVSQGYAAGVAEAGDTIESLISLADRVLYHVKENGRDNYKIMDCYEIIKEMH